MTNYKTTDIKIEGTTKREYMNILNTIAHRKIESMKDSIPFANGEYVVRLTSYLQDGELTSYNGFDLRIGRFLYKTKKIVEDGYDDRWMYISYEEFLAFQREMNINEVLGLETKLISHYPKRRLEKPFEVKVGDILGWYGVAKFIVTKVTPRTFTYNYIVNIDTMEVSEWCGDETARIRDHGNGPVWITESDKVLNKIE